MVHMVMPSLRPWQSPNPMCWQPSWLKFMKSFLQCFFKEDFGKMICVYVGRLQNVVCDRVCPFYAHDPHTSSLLMCGIYHHHTFNPFFVRLQRKKRRCTFFAISDLFVSRVTAFNVIVKIFLFRLQNLLF